MTFDLSLSYVLLKPIDVEAHSANEGKVKGKELVESYCSWSKSLVKMLRLSSKDRVACGFVVSRGFHGEVSKLSGLTSKASCGLTRF